MIFFFKLCNLYLNYIIPSLSLTHTHTHTYTHTHIHPETQTGTVILSSQPKHQCLVFQFHDRQAAAINIFCLFVNMCMCICLYACVSVCEWERERERESCIICIVTTFQISCVYSRQIFLILDDPNGCILIFRNLLGHCGLHVVWILWSNSGFGQEWIRARKHVQYLQCIQPVLQLSGWREIPVWLSYLNPGCMSRQLIHCHQMSR